MKGGSRRPELYNLLESGDLVSARANEMWYSVAKKERIRFPPADDASDSKEGVWRGRDLAVRFIGKCARGQDQTAVITHDENEAAYLAKKLASGEKPLLRNWGNVSGEKRHT